MKKELVEVVFDRRKNSEKRGYGFLEVQVYLGRATRKYIMIGKYSPDDWQAAAASPETQALVAKCKKIIAAMDVLDEERTYDNFMYHFNGEDKKPNYPVRIADMSCESVYFINTPALHIRTMSSAKFFR